MVVHSLQFMARLYQALVVEVVVMVAAVAAVAAETAHHLGVVVVGAGHAQMMQVLSPVRVVMVLGVLCIFIVGDYQKNGFNRF
jgi:hypothetical protein